MAVGERLGRVEGPAREAWERLTAEKAVERAFQGDHTIWQDDPREVADRLGWLHSPREMLGQVDDLDAFARGARADGLTHAVLMGMGGSSLFPEVLARTFGSRDGYLQLTVLDTTDPQAIRRVADENPPDATLFVAASKSGSTIETRSHLALFWDRVARPEQFAVITDPGSEFARLAVNRGFRRIFENRPDIGGRYSALSYFGLVPGALLGVDLRALLQRAIAALDDPAPGARLGAVLGASATVGRDKLTLVLPPEIATFGLWLEQLIAESTGKHAKGIVPVEGEELGGPDVYGDDRLFVALGDGHEGELDALAGAGHPVVVLPFREPLDVGYEVVRWELATAMAGAVLGINPFDQPNVAEAKDATAKVLAAGLPEIAERPLDELLAQVRPGDYVAIQAYVDPFDTALVEGLQRSRMAVRDRLRVATTLGLGPRFLHSTGQLHKGGPPTGVFPQAVGPDQAELPIPGLPSGFSFLKQAQAAGDLLTLQQHHLRASRVSLADLLAYG